jgi:alanine dehydrogenase
VGAAGRASSDHKGVVINSHLGRGFPTIALARETESPENPGALERRVALFPDDVIRLVSAGIEVFVETGAGEGVGFSDDEYCDSGATMRDGDAIYASAGLIIKFKGPSLAAIEQMRPGSTLFCMAHFNSYPERAKLLEDRQINVIAMEEILQSPKAQTDADILGRLAMAAALEPFIKAGTMHALNVRIIGWSERMRQAINRCGNRNPASLEVIQPALAFEELDAAGPDALYFYDSLSFDDPNAILERLKSAGTAVFDLA